MNLMQLCSYLDRRGCVRTLLVRYQGRAYARKQGHCWPTEGALPRRQATVYR